MVDTCALGAHAFGRGGSSPLLGTKEDTRKLLGVIEPRSRGNPGVSADDLTVREQEFDDLAFFGSCGEYIKPSKVFRQFEEFAKGSLNLALIALASLALLDSGFLDQQLPVFCPIGPLVDCPRDQGIGEPVEFGSDPAQVRHFNFAVLIFARGLYAFGQRCFERAHLSWRKCQATKGRENIALNGGLPDSLR